MRTIIITGASGGLAQEMVKLLPEDRLILLGRNQEKLEQLYADHPQKECIGIDITDSSAVQKLVQELYQRYGKIDVLVNNAGITRDKIMLKMTEEDFEQVLKVNLTGAFNMTQAVLKPMTKARQGAIINLSSVVGLTGNVGQANYAASKAGLIGFSKSVAREVAGRNIRVNVIAPGFIESDMTDGLSEKIKEASLAQIPMKRFGNTEEVADVALFLADQEYLTGQVIAIDGGLTMQ